jgi:iron complex transport system substrate-binding protein
VEILIGTAAGLAHRFANMPPRLYVFLGLLLACIAASQAARAGEVEVRVVSQTVGTDELLLALAETGQIAALSHLATTAEYAVLAREAAAYPRISSGDSETILRHRPTLVLFANYSRVELIAQVRRSGVTVLIFDRYATLSDVYANLRILGRALGGGAPERAEALIARCETRLAALREKLRGVRPVKVVSATTYGLVSGAGTTFQDLCDHAGAENLATTLGGLSGHAPEPTEKMLGWPVEQVVVGLDPEAQGMADDGPAARERALAPLRKIPPYMFMDAVKKGRAVVLPAAYLGCVSHLRIDGYEALAKALHPEAMR